MHSISRLTVFDHPLATRQWVFESSRSSTRPEHNKYRINISPAVITQANWSLLLLLVESVKLIFHPVFKWPLPWAKTTRVCARDLSIAVSNSPYYCCRYHLLTICKENCLWICYGSTQINWKDFHQGTSLQAFKRSHPVCMQICNLNK